MKFKYFGLFLILIGFATPFILAAIFPAFFYGLVLSVLCFWAGFLLILQPLNYDHKFNPYLKWARFAVWINIMLSILLVLYFYPVLDSGRRQGGFVLNMMLVLSFVANPIQSIFNRLVAQPSVQQADGSILIIYSFIRALLTNFFNLVFYSISGILIKILKDKIGLQRSAKTARPLNFI